MKEEAEAVPDEARISLGPLQIEAGRLFFILGPCMLESEEMAWAYARQLKETAQALSFSLIYKASCDKANRSSISSQRGPGLREGCRILGEIGRELQIPVTTDVHSPADVEIAAEEIDLLQIPAFLCRQTDLIVAAARSGRAVNVKKGQFLAPWDVRNIADKLNHCENGNFFFTERGTTFGYGNLVADMRSLYWMRELGYRVIFDATHSVQRPGSEGATTGGDRELAPVLARAAVATGCDGVFMEAHASPDEALSDGPNQIPLAALPDIIQRLMAIHESAHC